MFRTSQSLSRLVPRSSSSSLLHRQPPTARPKLIISPTISSSSRHFPPAILLLHHRRLASTKRRDDDPPPPRQPVDREAERRAAHQKIKPTPGGVSTQSSTRPTFETGGSQASSATPGDDEKDLSKGIKEELEVVRDAFRLDTVPRESHILGLAGTVPYLLTSISTVYLGWDLAQTWPTGSAFKDTFLINHDTARYLISIIEPLQLGYGAVIISFLGAIHWGLEYAEKTPLRARTRFRYGIGLAASITAWPTLLMPVPYALTTQFMAFVALYFADARAAARGWAPAWYAPYRFLLTAMVGLAILVSLVGRSEIQEAGRLSKKGLRRDMKHAELADRETDWAKLEKKEKEENRKKKKLVEEKKKKQQQQQQQQEAEEKEKKKQAEEKGDRKGDGEKQKGTEKEGQAGEKQHGQQQEETGKQKQEKDDGDKDKGKETTQQSEENKVADKE